MLWLYIAAAGAGALLGLLRLRVLAVLAVSIILAAISVVWTTIEQWPVTGAAVNVFTLLATLQFSYLVVLVLSVLGRDRRRGPSWVPLPAGGSAETTGLASRGRARSLGDESNNVEPY